MFGYFKVGEHCNVVGIDGIFFILCYHIKAGVLVFPSSMLNLLGVSGESDFHVRLWLFIFS